MKAIFSNDQFGIKTTRKFIACEAFLYARRLISDSYFLAVACTQSLIVDVGILTPMSAYCLTCRYSGK